MPKPTPKRSVVVAANAINLATIGMIVSNAGPKKSGLKERAMANIANLTAIDRVMEDLEDARDVECAKVRAAGLEIMLDNGCAAKGRPDNFRAIETEVIGGCPVTHSANIEMRRLATPLTEEACQLAADYNIPTRTEIETHATYVINPALAECQPVIEAVIAALNAGMDKISAAMTAANIDVATNQVLMYQAGKSKVLTTDDTIPAIFKQPREVAELLLAAFTTKLTVGKMSYASPPGQADDLGPAMLRTAELIHRPGFRELMTQARETRKSEEKKRYAAAATKKAAA